MSKISQFQGTYRWLSNFAECKIILNQYTYNSVEHAYQSAKSNLKSWKEFCSTTNSPAIVKKHSKNIKLSKNWNNIKVNIMRECLLQKYYQEPYKSLLLKTGNSYIQEGNTWNDAFWGVDLYTNTGQNILGKLIMEIRTHLEEKEKQMPCDFLIYDFATLDTNSSSAIISFSAIAGTFNNIENRNTYNILDLYFQTKPQIKTYNRTTNAATIEYWKSLPKNISDYISSQEKLDLAELAKQFTEFYQKHCNSYTKIFVKDKSFDPLILQSIFQEFNTPIPYKYNYYIKDITTLIDVCIDSHKLDKLGNIVTDKYKDIPNTSLSNCYIDILKTYYALTKTEQEIENILNKGVA